MLFRLHNRRKCPALTEMVIPGRKYRYKMWSSMRRAIYGAIFGLAFAVSWAQTKAPKTDAEIKQQIINESIAAYRGNCPCPYNTDRAGHRCGKRSAYSRPGGASPLCYAADVSQKMVDDYGRKTNQ